MKAASKLKRTSPVLVPATPNGKRNTRGVFLQSQSEPTFNHSYVATEDMIKV